MKRIIDACESESLLNEFYPEPDWANTPNEDGVYPGPYYRSRWLRTETHDGKQIWRCASHVTNRIFPDGSADQRWYGWRSSEAGWGTKWEVGDIYIDQQDDGTLLLSFMSAWCPPGDTWFEKLSEAMPNAVITNTFSEPGCDFFGMQYATGGVCLSKCLEISSLKEPWVEKTLSPKDLAIYKDDSHERYDEIHDDIDEQWYDASGELMDEALGPIMDALKVAVAA